MKTTKEIIGHDPVSNDFYFKKWFSEEELRRAIKKHSYVQEHSDLFDVDGNRLLEELGLK